jgi:hypothetical protein
MIFRSAHFEKNVTGINRQRYIFIHVHIVDERVFWEMQQQKVSLTLSVLSQFTNTTFLTCTGALIGNYLPDEASGVDEFWTMNRQDGHLQFDPKRSNLRSYAHGQLGLEQAKLAIA